MTNVWRVSDASQRRQLEDSSVPVTIVGVWVAWFALASILVIGANLLLTPTARRNGPGRDRDALAPEGDPAQYRRRRPFTQRLSGAVLIVSALYLFGVLRPLLGVG